MVEVVVIGMFVEDIVGEEDDCYDEYGFGGNGYLCCGFEYFGGLVRWWCWGFRCFIYVLYDVLVNSNVIMCFLCSSCECVGWVLVWDIIMVVFWC